MESDGASDAAMVSLGTSRPMKSARPEDGSLGEEPREETLSKEVGVEALELLCGSTGGKGLGMYGLMVCVFHLLVVWGAGPTTCDSAPLARRNPRLSRRTDTAFAFIASHTV